MFLVVLVCLSATYKPPIKPPPFSNEAVSVAWHSTCGGFCIRLPWDYKGRRQVLREQWRGGAPVSHIISLNINKWTGMTPTACTQTYGIFWTITVYLYRHCCTALQRQKAITYLIQVINYCLLALHGRQYLNCSMTWDITISQKTLKRDPLLSWCWPSLADGVQNIGSYWADLSCFMWLCWLGNHTLLSLSDVVTHHSLRSALKQSWANLTDTRTKLCQQWYNDVRMLTLKPLYIW